ncbi:MAG: hypothetical protein M3R02_06460 [Chloroflexota bacterium]|nr:hypothetical protein [Chloroflexota bacterium]
MKFTLIDRGKAPVPSVIGGILGFEGFAGCLRGMARSPTRGATNSAPILTQPRPSAGRTHPPVPPRATRALRRSGDGARGDGRAG